jgi:FAD/FMN-containing dehydrogenase
MTLDSLLSADVVLADGSIIHCDKTTESDLFWGLRGGKFMTTTNFLQ